LPLYLEALRSPTASIADAAAAALAASGQYDATRLLPLFLDPGVSKARLETILAARVQSLEPRLLLQLLPDLGREARGGVFRLLEKRIDPSLVSDAARLATHTDWWLRLHMVKLLAHCPGRESSQVVTKLLADENVSVRLTAVRCLAGLKDAGAIPALCGRLRDPDLKVQAAAIEALVQIGDVGAVVHLLEYLKDESEQVRRGAVEVLNEVVTTDAIKDLVSALRDQDWWVRVRAADALGTLGGPRVVEAVIDLMTDPEDFMRRYAVEILNVVPDERAVEPLIRALDDPDWWVRERAIDALARARDARAVDPLLRVLSGESRAIPLCVRALTAIGDARAIDAISRLARSDDPEIRREVAGSLTQLARLEMPEATRAILTGALDSLRGRDPAARLAAERPRSGPERGAEIQPIRRPNERPSDLVPAIAPAPAPSPSKAAATPVPALNFHSLDPGVLLAERWRVIRRIGGGGFGTVYLVEDTVVKEDLVLKVLLPHLSVDESMIRRFVQELKYTRHITHRNVIRIYDLLDLGGAHAISMEYFPGRDLGQLLQAEGKLPAERALNIASQALEGLAAAHELGIVHRDIKPPNLLIGEGDATKIVDFGLAAVGQSTRSRLTRSGILIGTPEYISPEQISGTAVDGRSDLYSLGCVLFRMLSGRDPFSGDNAVNVLFQHVEGEVPRLDEAVPGITPELSDLVYRAMARQPADRPASAADMLESLSMLRRAA
jgi:serine/threonine-protein kinase